MEGNLYPLAVFFGAIFTNNILLVNYLGMCPFLSIAKEFKASVGLGIAVIFVMTVTSVLNWAVYEFILEPFGLEYLRFIMFIMVIAAFVQLVEMIIERVSENLYAALGIFLPLITVNCSILGVSLFMVIREYTLIATLFFGLGSGLGWFLAILSMAGILEKLRKARLPKGLEGPGITLIITGIMALAFMGFAGILPIS